MKKLTISLWAMLFSLIANAGNNYVDLGLPSGLLWATCNIGAESPEQFGNYYDWTNNPVLEYWDDTWHTPTKADRDELVQYCTYSVVCTGGLSPCALFCSFAWWVERFLVHLQRLKYVILWQDKQGKPVVLAYIM